MYWITPEGEYVVGDRPTLRHVACAARPSQLHTWSGTAWQLSLGVYKAAKTAEIKAEAGRRILAQYGILDGKQINMVKRSTQLLDALRTRTLTTTEDSERATLLTCGDWVDTVRAASRAVEDAIAAASTVAGVDAAVAAVVWPTATPPVWPL